LQDGQGETSTDDVLGNATAPITRTVGVGVNIERDYRFLDVWFDLTDVAVGD
jgi:hypothetical protein